MEPGEENFVVEASAADVERPLLLVGLSLERLIEDVIAPFEEQRPFFMDGVQVEKGRKIRWIRIYRDNNGFLKSNLYKLHQQLWRGDSTIRKREDYELQVLGVLKAHGEDVTARVLTVYSRTIGDRVKDWFKESPEQKLKLLTEIAKLLPGAGGVTG